MATRLARRLPLWDYRFAMDEKLKVYQMNLEGEMDEVFLNFDRPAGREAGELDQLVAVGDFQKSQLRSPRRGFPLDHFEAQHVRIKLNRLIQITDSHAGVEEFGDLHMRSL